MEHALEEFWRTTWKAWRSGQLGVVSSSFIGHANSGFADFLKTYPPACGPMIVELFADNPLLPNEFLLEFKKTTRAITLLLTNRRLWLYDHKEDETLCFDLNDVSSLNGKSKWNSIDVHVCFKDGTDDTYHDVAAIPNMEILSAALKRTDAAEDWGKRFTHLTSADSEDTNLKNVEPLLEKPLKGEKPRAYGFAYWSTPGSSLETALDKTAGALVLGSYGYHAAKSTHRIGIVAVTTNTLYLICTGKTEGEDPQIADVLRGLRCADALCIPLKGIFVTERGELALGRFGLGGRLGASLGLGLTLNFLCSTAEGTMDKAVEIMDAIERRNPEGVHSG